MDIARTIGRIAAVLATVGALTAVAGFAQAETSGPPGMSPAEYKSLMLRSEALNQRSGLGSQGAVPQGMTPAGFRALMLRSEALNQSTLGERAVAVVASQPTDPTRGFAWGAFGIGATVMFGLTLLAGGLFVRYRPFATRRVLTPRGTT